MSKIFCSKCKNVHERGEGCPKKDYPFLDSDNPREKSHSKTYAEMNEEELRIQKFYNSKEWRKMRDRMLERTNGLCAVCWMKGIVRNAVAVHHIKKLRTHFHLRLDEDNLICVCRSCHELVEDTCSSLEEIFELIKKEKKK